MKPFHIKFVLFLSGKYWRFFMQADISIFLALGAGVLTFLSPCVFPLYPAFLSYITGLSVGEIQNGELKGQRKAIFHTISFLIGFSVIYLVLGFGTAEGATKLEAWYFQSPF